MYSSGTMLWKGKDRFRIRALQMDNLRSLLGLRKMDRVPNAWMRELCGVMNEVDERIDDGVLRWFGHEERRRGCRMIGLLREFYR